MGTQNTNTLYPETRKFEWVYAAVLVLTFIHLVEYPIWHNDSINRLVWIPGLLLLFFCCLLLLPKQTMKLPEFFAFLVLATIILAGWLCSGRMTDYNLILSCASFFFLLLSTSLFSKTSISKRLFDTIFYFGVASSLLFFVYSFTPLATMYERDGGYAHYVHFVFNLNNANTAGMYLFFLFCVLLINLPIRKGKLWLIALSAADLYMIFRTNARSCIISALAVAVLAFLPKLRHMSKLLIIVCWLFPIVFVSLYLFLYRSGYDDIVVLNKDLFSGRENTFVEYLSTIKNDWHVWFGNLGEAGLANAHNAPLSHYTSLGLVGATLTQLMLLVNVLRLNRNTRISFLAIAAILGCFLQSSAEAGIFVGGFPGSVFLALFFLMANYDDYETALIIQEKQGGTTQDDRLRI